MSVKGQANSCYFDVGGCNEINLHGADLPELKPWRHVMWLTTAVLLMTGMMGDDSLVSKYDPQVCMNS
jgi:hypothetical protein